MSDKTVEELVEEAKKPGTFKILDAIRERSYPKEEVIVYLDEDAAYRASEVKEKINELIADDVAESLNKELEEYTTRLNNSKYIFTVNGIPEGIREDCLREASEKYPIEYIESKNSFTGETTREEKEDPSRDRLFTSLLWRAQIGSIVSPDGDIQKELDIETVNELRRALPIAAVGKINEAIEKMRIASAVFMYSADEDFLAKS